MIDLHYWPTLLLEGMAVGLPVVASDLRGVRDYVTSDCARLVMRREPEAMVEALSALADSRDTLLDMAVASRERAMELDWGQVAKQMLNVYEKATL